MILPDFFLEEGGVDDLVPLLSGQLSILALVDSTYDFKQLPRIHGVHLSPNVLEPEERLDYFLLLVVGGRQLCL